MYSISRHTLFFFLLILSLSLFLFGCGNSAATPAQGTPASNAPTQASPQEHTVKDAMGEVKVPAEPKRIVVLDNGALDNLLGLGVTPVGAATVSLDKPFFSYLGDKTSGIEKVGTIDQPNLEAVSALKPDLILGTKDQHEAIHSKLMQIAPTVFVETLGLDWKGNLKLHAEAVGKAKEAEKMIGDYEKRVAEFKAKMGDKVGKTEVSMLRMNADHIRIYLSESYSGKFIEELGFPRPKAQSEKEFAKKATEEQIADMDGDVIFWFSRDQENIMTTKLKDNPLWATLKAVQAGNVYEVSTDPWLSGMGVVSRNLMLDEVIKHLDK
ncbi:ABC transporter substrate-binding protein [Brevibacillus borstelensis]|uniref:ABC transporter substrate-binding protein n=1 Tax=Brevibacillus borstelensis TaxID=45462 RepID=UPI0030BCDDDC